ncbi:MAG: HAMP domain-containing histidine kinase, partial [Lachnospiraceae bacterium]|nr:HAMP domain-containing histidine kinase [Lachnospiraceae bacterium]
MENQSNQQNATEKGKKHKRGAGLKLLHLLQHILFVTAVLLLVVVLNRSYVVVDTLRGAQAYELTGVEENETFEDSEVFNTLLGNSISDIICFGTIRGQLETDSEFDGGKKVDVTAFAGRYNGVMSEYITAEYYLEDLIKWAQAGFDYERVYMSGEDVDRFLSRKRTVTKVNLDDYSGGTVSYLNTDLSSSVTVEDVSGNFLEEGMTDRDPADANVMNNRYHTVEGKNIEDYVSTWEEYYELCGNVKKAAEDLSTNYNEYIKYKDYYDLGNSNVVYVISRTIGNKTQIFSNMEIGSEKLSELKKELLEQCDRYVYYDPFNMQYDTNTLIEESTLRYILNGYEYSYPDNTQIMIGVRSGYGTKDCFYQANAGFGSFVPYIWQYLLCALVLGGVYLFLLALLTIKEGTVYRKNIGERRHRLHPEDHIPTEIMLLAGIASAFLLAYVGKRGLDWWLWNSAENEVKVILAGIFALVVSVLFSIFYYSFVRRIKAGRIWKDSLLYRLGQSVKKGVAYVYDCSAVILRVWIPYILLILLNLGGGLVIGNLVYNGGKAAFLGCALLLMADGAAGYILYRSALAKQLILEGIELIKNGNLTHKVGEEGMHGDDLLLARAVNSIGESVRTAVETSMKDERLKADLITNVSHDIKTPLTSIINYVDLIKRENVQEPKVREYIEILDAKSQRLKQLTDDLVEASKISSGNIVLQWEKINLVELLNQTIGEFSEKFEEKALYPVWNAPKGSVYIEADSRRIWRVIE